MIAGNLTALQPLVGSWRGKGQGSYPTISEFAYTEELTFTDVGKPFLVYQQRTWAEDGRPLHVETGYLRCPVAGIAELTLAQPTGHTEIGHGTISRDPLGVRLDCRVDATDSAKPVSATRREWSLIEDELVVGFAMAAVGEPLTGHLVSRLRLQG